MTDIAIVEGGVTPGRTPFSWSAAIAGVFAAVAVSFIIISLGSGIGLSFTSPTGNGPSAESLTLAAAIWLVMAQAMGFAAGGYLAGRLRSPAYDGVPGETRFRDAAQGFVVWALGVVVMAAAVGGLGLLAAGAGTRTAANVAGAASGSASEGAAARGPAATTTEYFVDLMFRPAPAAATASNHAGDTTGAAPASAQPSLNRETRAEVTRILARAVSQAGIDESDRTYLAQVVAARTGLPPDEAQHRVETVENKAREAVKEAADKVAKAGAYFSFWTFMSLLFGGAAGTLAGMLGGELRDAEGRVA